MNSSLQRDRTLIYPRGKAISLQTERMDGVGDGNRTLAKLKTNDLNRARVTPNASSDCICAVIVPRLYPCFFSLRFPVFSKERGGGL
jgi:hypothetical protein